MQGRTEAVPADVVGLTGSDAARAQLTPAPAPQAVPAYVDPRLESLWAVRDTLGVASSAPPVVVRGPTDRSAREAASAA